MTQAEPPALGDSLPPNVLQIALLAVGAAGSVCSVLIGMALLVAAADRPGGVTLLDLAAFGGFVVAGAGAMVLCWWAYYVAGRLRWARGVAFGAPYANESPLQAIPVDGAIPAADLATPMSAEQGQRICAALDRLNAALLMSPAERRALREKLRARKLSSLKVAGASALAKGDFQSAEAVRRALAEHGDEPAEALREKIASDRQVVEGEALRWTSDYCHDLMAVSDFDAAEAAARRLAASCPNSPGAGALLSQIRRERQAYDAEQRETMFRQIDRYAYERQWRKAVSVANTLRQRHPGSAEAEIVAGKMPTLNDNARLEEVRELRDQIASTVAAKQYEQAVRLATTVLERFPETAAAQALRGHIDRMKQLAVETGPTG